MVEIHELQSQVTIGKSQKQDTSKGESIREGEKNTEGLEGKER